MKDFFIRIILLCFISLFLIPLLTSCEQDDEDWEAEKISNHVDKKHIEKQYKKYGFNCTGAGGGGNGKEFTLFKLVFSTREQLTIDSARRYLVEGVLDYQNEINSDEPLQKYLVESPFPISRLAYIIQTVVGNGVWPIFPDGRSPDNKISYITMSEMKVRYLIDVDPDKLPVEIHNETLEEAQAIVESERE